MWIISTLISSTHVIQAGRIGIVYSLGEITGQIPEGLQFIAPWKSAKIENVQIRSYRFPKLECFSRETQDVFVAATLNLNVSPQAVQNLYRTVGINWYVVLVEPRVGQIFKDETVKFSSVDIAPNRETIRKIVRERLEKELTLYSIEVKDLLVDNVDFRPEFKAAIEKKQIATQKALEEAALVSVKKAQADQAIEEARGKAEAIYVTAKKQADANKALNESLTENLIRYTMISKLSDKIEVMILPAGQSFILDKNFLQKEKGKE